VAAERARAAALAADRVELVDEDDRRGRFLGLVEQVAYAGGPHANDHLHELAGAQREEGDVGLARDRAGQQRLAGAGLPGQQHALGDRAAQAPVAVGVAQEVDDLDQLVLGLVDPGDVLERRALLGRFVALGLRAAEAAQPAGATAGRGAAEQPDEDADQQQRRAEAEDQRLPERRALVELLRVDGDVLLEHQPQEPVVAERGPHGLEVVVAAGLAAVRGLVLGLLLELALDPVALGGDLLDVALLDLRAEERVGHVHALLGAREQRAEGEVRDQGDRDEGPDPARARDHGRLAALPVGLALDPPGLGVRGVGLAFGGSRLRHGLS
jgi:hypothetical protein